MNKELLSEVVDIISPETWNQNTWVSVKRVPDDAPEVGEYGWKEYGATPSLNNGCGTKGCIAGLVALRDGVGFRFIREPSIGGYWAEQTIDGPTIRDYAKSRLELTEEQADYLFESYRTEEEIRDFLDSDGVVPEGEW